MGGVFRRRVDGEGAEFLAVSDEGELLAVGGEARNRVVESLASELLFGLRGEVVEVEVGVAGAFGEVGDAFGIGSPGDGGFSGRRRGAGGFAAVLGRGGPRFRRGR